MRNDLTSAFLAEMASNGRSPIQLLIFHFNFGDVFISDRDIVIDGQLYEGIIEDWGSLSTVGDIDQQSGTYEQTISLWNGGKEPFSNYFLIEDPVNVFVDQYQTFLGLPFSDAAIIGNFVIQDPIEVTEASQLIKLDLVTTNLRYFAQVGSLLTKENFPYALESDINKPINFIVGNAGEVETLCSNTPPRCTQSGSILANPTILNVLEDLDELLFLDSGFIQIDAEIMFYASRNSFSFNITSRGYGQSIATDHSDGSSIIQANRSVEYIVGEGPISSIFNVLVNGQTPSGIYTIHPSENPAVIRFQEQPTYIEYSRGARNTESEFDAVGPLNTAFQPHYAYDLTTRAYGALISKLYRTLSIIQNDVPEDDGELVRAFLSVEHWETDFYSNDVVDVWVDGIGVVGQLSKPNPADLLLVNADIDIDHSHDHVDGGLHNHPLVNPGLNVNDPSHLHGLSQIGKQVINYTNKQSSLPLTILQGSNVSTKTEIFTIPIVAGAFSQKVHIRFSSAGISYVTLRVGGIFGGVFTQWDLGINSNIDEYITLPTFAYTSMTLVIGPYTAVGASILLKELALESMIPSTADYANSGISASLSANGQVVYNQIDTSGIPLKDINDVDDLTAENRRLENIVTTKSSKAIKDKFDLTKHLTSISWDWLTNREVRLIYVGSTDTTNIIVTHIWFDIEYRQKQIRTTDIVTANVVGLIDNRPDAVIQHLLTNKAFVPLEKLGSVIRTIPKWDDEKIWNDIEVWIDEGEVSGVPAGAYFEEAASWFNFKNYKIDGIIQGNITIKDAINKITFQTRSLLYWQNGFAKLVIKRISDSWNIGKDIGTDLIRMRSFKESKSRSTDIINKIDLFYGVDRLSEAQGSGAYKNTAFRNDQASIEKHGEKKQDELFLFDLIRDTDTAENISDYYIWERGETRTRYNFDTYLPNFDIEKGEYVTISSNKFASLNMLPVTIIDIKRIFGSGKNLQINLLNMIGESVRHYNYLSKFEFETIVTDNLNILFGSEYEFEDTINLSDNVLISQGKSFQEDVIFSDFFSSKINFNSNVEESIAFIGDQTFNIEIAVHEESAVIVQDDIGISQALCFGACGFGAPNCIGVTFGSKTEIKEIAIDYNLISDEYSFNVKPFITDESQISDSLVFSDGFGCPTGLGDGFGLSTFGC